MRIVIFETSGSAGGVALADRAEVLAARDLPAAQKHARDLIPLLHELLTERGWRPAAIDLVLVDIGPGSYTGLRVGVMAAKTLAYVTGAALVAVDAPTALAEQAPTTFPAVSVIIDAQQGRVYSTLYRREGGILKLAEPTVIGAAADWAQQLLPGTYVTGPALNRYAALVPAHCVVAEEAERNVDVRTLHRVGLRNYDQGVRHDLWGLEPLYLRPSAAEQKWQEKRGHTQDPR